MAAVSVAAVPSMLPVLLVSVIAAAAAPYVHLAEPAAQVNDPRLSSVPLLSVVAAVPPAESFPFKSVAKVYEHAPTFAPSAASVDLAAVSVAGSLSAPSVDAAGYVDAAQSTFHGHFQPSSAAVAAGTDLNVYGGYSRRMNWKWKK